MELKFGTFLGRCRLAGIYCAEKISPPDIQKTNRVRLFKAYIRVLTEKFWCCCVFNYHIKNIGSEATVPYFVLSET